MSISHPRTDPIGGHGDAETPDAELVARARAGDRDAVDLLVARHLGTVRAVCRSRLRSPHDVNDAIQETFLRALPRLSEVRDPDRVGAWLRAIAVRVCVDQHRATARTVAQPAPGVDQADLGRGPEEHAIGRDAARSLHSRLASLSDRDARALWMRDAHGAGVTEVARDLGVTEGSARVLLTRARHRLRATYQGLVGVAAVGWLRLRQRITELLGPGGLGEGRGVAVVAVAQATLAAAIVMTVLPSVGEGSTADPGSRAPALEQTSVASPSPGSPTGALPGPVPPSAPSPRARSSAGPSAVDPGTATAPDVRAGPVVVTDETPDEQPAAAIEAGDHGEIAEALIYAGNLVPGERPPGSQGQGGDAPDDEDDGDDGEDGEDEDLTIGRELVREIIGGARP